MSSTPRSRPAALRMNGPLRIDASSGKKTTSAGALRVPTGYRLMALVEPDTRSAGFTVPRLSMAGPWCLMSASGQFLVAVSEQFLVAAVNLPGPAT